METELVGLFRDLVRLETDLWDRVDEEAQRAYGVPLAWVEVMQVIEATNDCRVLDVARALVITVGGASKVVDKLEAAGRCRREPNPVDGRSSLIRLTGPGAELLPRANRTSAAALSTLLGGAASEEELTRLSVGLRRLREHLGRPAPVPAGAR